MFYIKYLFFFIVFFLLHYLEGLPPIWGIPFAQIWKAPVLLYFIFLFFDGEKRRKEKFETRGYIYSFEPFFCPAILTNPKSVIIFAIKQLPLVLSYNFWLRKFSSRKRTIETIIICYAQYILLTSLVTLTGLVTPMHSYMSADSYMTGLSYYCSVFGAPHAASSYFALSIVVLIFGFKQKRFRSKGAKIFNLLLILVGFYSIFLSYVRTGWLMLLVALIYPMWLDVKKRKKNSLLKMIFFLCIGIFGLIYFYNTNNAFQRRITGATRYQEGSGVIDVGGSGRIDFWKSGIKHWSENNFYGLLFGKGYDDVLRDNRQDNGMAVFSHNQFVDSLAQYGLLSLLFLILFYWGLFQYVLASRNDNCYKQLCSTILLSSFIFSFFQNELYFNFAVLLSGCLALLCIEDRGLRECDNNVVN